MNKRASGKTGRPACRAESLTKTYSGGATAVVALSEISLAMPSGGFTAVMGPSGCGKSTLLHCLAGLDRPSSGKVFVGEVDLGGLDDRGLARFRRDRIGFIFQSYNLVPSLTAAENINLASLLGGAALDPEWLGHVVEVLDIAGRLGHFPAQLSGGQQQRVAAARALATRPEVIFADEPTGNLDSTARNDLLGLLRASVDEERQTVVMVTHDPVAAAHADRTLVLRDGRITTTLERSSATAIASHLAEARPRPRARSTSRR